jgi:hypothetical protein
MTRAEVVEGTGFGREAFNILVSVGLLPTTKRPSSQPVALVT